MKFNPTFIAKTGFLLCALSVILGAFASHILKKYLPAEDLRVFNTGVQYQFIHSMAIWVLALLHKKFKGNKLQYALYLFLTGIILFSGSLYLLATFSMWGDDRYSWIGVLTPLGGISFISGWCLLLLSSIKNKKKEAKKKRHAHKKLNKQKASEDIGQIGVS